MREYLRRFHDSFHDSEVIFWARFQLVLACAWAVISTTDLSPYISNPKFLTAWLMINGFVTEYLRRRREDFRGDKP